jgi:mannose-6-phosphate isomerase-like protein (cupin superfamily)
MKKVGMGLFLFTLALSGPLAAAADVQSAQKGYVVNIEQVTRENSNFRKVLFTAKHSQLVVMSLNPGEDIGAEVHHLDQFFRCETGQGKAVLNGVEYDITDGFALMIPAGVRHNLINVSKDKPLKLYTIYSPPNHLDGTVFKTKAEAQASKEHFDGKTTEK